MDVEQRFWSKVAKGGPDECWPWLGRKNAKGYGVFDDENWKQVRAHAYAFKLAGRTLPASHNHDHTCYNTSCVNPAHLDTTTPLENIQRGRVRQARLCQAADKPATHNAKLTADQVRAIRADPRGWRRLSKVLPFSKSAIKEVKERKTYKHIV